MQANGQIFYSNKHINGLAVMWSLKSLRKRKKKWLQALGTESKSPMPLAQQNKKNKAE